MDPIEDYSRVDAYAAGRRRALQARELWKPIVAGSLASLAVSATIWVILPKVSYREIAIEVPKVTYKNVTVPAVEVTTHSVDIPIPRVVPETSAAAPRSKEAFVASPEYRAAPLSGIIKAPWKNGFIFADGQTFTPWRIDASGHPKLADDAWDDVSNLIGAPAYCEPQPNGLLVCQAWQKGFGVVDIPVRPVVRAPKGGKPTRAPSTVVTRPAIEARR
jgi:hypothetical protein